MKCGKQLLGAWAAAGLVLATAGPARAHTTEQAFVLLLPTGVYTAAGVAAVALSVIVLGLLPAGATARLLRSTDIAAAMPDPPAVFTSIASTVIVAALVVAGFAGSRDPLVNLLPLTVWTVWWIGFVTLQAVFGDLWRWLNPWTGLYRVLTGNRQSPPFTLPPAIGHVIAIAGFIGFGLFMLADIAPDDPARLAVVVAAYWLATFSCMLLFGGETWLGRCECFTVLLGFYARLSPFGMKDGRLRIGFPTWQLLDTPPLTLTAGAFAIMLLATGSFDGLNETFWWLAQIGVNPLEFPGRSAVVTETATGLVLANVLLVAIFALTIRLGLSLAKSDVSFRTVFGRQGLSILPIAMGYHVAHYLTAVLVQGQYALKAANDPFNAGWNLLGLAGYRVTTGFFNAQDTVHVIWLSQAAAVVIGHILSVLIAHAIAVQLFGSNRQAVLSQLPLAVFMILYTFFGLWLLASPRGA